MKAGANLPRAFFETLRDRNVLPAFGIDNSGPYSIR